MSILFIGPLPEPVTGQSKACEVFLDELKNNHRVEVVNLSKNGFRQGVSSLSRVFAVAAILYSVWRKKKSARAIYFTIAESCAGNMKDLFLYLLCFKKLNRMIVHLHGGNGMRSIMLGKRTLQRRLNEFFLRRIGGAIVLGSSMVEIFKDALPESRIHVVPNFAEDFIFIEPEDVRRKFRSMRPLKILFLSNLLPGKGHEELIKAYMMLPESTQASIEIDFAGGFESEKQKSHFLSKLGGRPQIRYHGVVGGHQKKELLHQAHVFCLPTYYAYEGQPISILEAYAAGCAVITTNHSGIRDIFAADVNGYEVPKQSPADLSQVIEEAFFHGDRLLSIALSNLRAAQTDYRTAAYNARLLAIVDSKLRED